MRMQSAYLTAIAISAFATAAHSGEATPKLHPVEAACISYNTSGQMMTGVSTRCHRDYGYEQYEIQSTTVSIAGISQSQKQHTITIGEDIYSINLSTNTGTKTSNPFYDSIVSAMADTSAAEMSAQFMSAMGLTPNGETRTIVNTECNVYSSPTMGTVCMTEAGLMLEQSFMGTNVTATSVAMGDGGEDANYRLHETVPISDVSGVMNGFNLQGLGAQ